MYYYIFFQICCKSKNGSPRWTHIQTQTDTRIKYICETTQTGDHDHFRRRKYVAGGRSRTALETSRHAICITALISLSSATPRIHHISSSPSPVFRCSLLRCGTLQASANLCPPRAATHPIEALQLPPSCHLISPSTRLPCLSACASRFLGRLLLLLARWNTYVHYARNLPGEKHAGPPSWLVYE
jgi:hypothetical protein